jgi:hydrogenase expression/formation protein HypC
VNRKEHEEKKMCLAIPGRILELCADQKELAIVDISGVRRKINVQLLEEEPLGPGDWVLIHVGFAMSKISEEQALEQLRLLAMLGESEEAMLELESSIEPTGLDSSELGSAELSSVDLDSSKPN